MMMLVIASGLVAATALVPAGLANVKLEKLRLEARRRDADGPTAAH